MASLAGGESKAGNPLTLEEACESYADTNPAFVFPVGGFRGLVLPMEMKQRTNHKKTRLVNVIIVLDRSGSMGSQMDPLMYGLSSALKKLHPELKSHVVAFDNRVEIHKNIDSDRLPCLPVHARSTTYMGPTVCEVKKLLCPNTLIIVASDGAIDDPDDLRYQFRKLKSANIDHVTVIGLRVGSSKYADTKAISGWVTATGAKGALRTVPSVTSDNICTALCECFEETGLSSRVLSHILKLSYSGGVGKTPGEYLRECTVMPGDIIFIGNPNNPEDVDMTIDGQPLRVVEIKPPRNVILAFIRQSLRNIKFSIVSGNSDSNTEQRLRILLGIIPKAPSSEEWKFMTAAEIARRASEPKSEVKKLEYEIQEAINQAIVISKCSQQQMADFIRGTHAKTFAKRAAEAGVQELKDAILNAAEYIEDKHPQSEIACFLSLEDTYGSILSAAEQLRNGFSPESVRDVLNLVGIVGLAVDLNPRPVVADAWSLWGVMKTINDGEFMLSTSTHSQAMESGHTLEYPATRGEITGVVPIAEDEKSLKVLKILLPLLNTHAALCCFETTTTLPHMFTALLAETILAYIKQVASSGKTKFSDYSEKEKGTLRALCFTFNGLHLGAAFEEHLLDAEHKLSGDRDFSVTRLRVLAHIVSDMVLNHGTMDAERVLFKLYDLLMFRGVKRAAGRGQLDRNKCLQKILFNSEGLFTGPAGPFAYVKNPFEEGPTNLTRDMLSPISTTSDAAFAALACESFFTEHDGFLNEINRVRALLDLHPLQPDLVTIVVSLACKKESERPRTESERKILVQKLHLQLHQEMLESLLKKKQMEEKRISYQILHEKLLGAQTMEEFGLVLSGSTPDGESKDNTEITRTKIVGGINVFNHLVDSLLELAKAGDILARSKLIFIITGRLEEEFDKKNPDDLNTMCFDANPSTPHYSILRELVSDLQFENAKTFIKVLRYRESDKNRHGHSNDQPSFYALSGGQCNSLKDFSLKYPHLFAQYLLDNINKGSSGLRHPWFKTNLHDGDIGKAFLPKGALFERNDVLDWLKDVFVDKTMNHDTFRTRMVSSNEMWVMKNYPTKN